MQQHKHLAITIIVVVRMQCSNIDIVTLPSKYALKHTTL
uniref:Uncharacterized protein n=1 Tax=Arundo donax TaxID=35708 RepID=A0A0A9F4J4_ARUDO